MSSIDYNKSEDSDSLNENEKLILMKEPVPLSSEEDISYISWRYWIWKGFILILKLNAS